MRAENVSEEMERTINDTWLRMRKPDYEPTAKRVRASVVRELTDDGYTELELPKLRTFQEYLRRARKRQITLKQESKVDEHKSWNMETLNEFPLPSESIPYVLQLWRYSVALDTEFTIRQAKWASRLYCNYLLTESRPDIIELYFISRRYSHEEELSLLSNSEMLIFTLDSSLVMGNWELNNVIVTDFLKPKPMLYIKHTLIPRGPDSGVIEEFIHALPVLEDMETEEEDKRAHEIRRAIARLPSSSLYFEDFEIRMVYLRQLSFVAKGPKWNTLPPEEIFNVIVDLRNWTLETKERIDNPPIKSAKSILGISFDRTPFPNHLYTRVGYNY